MLIKRKKSFFCGNTIVLSTVEILKKYRKECYSHFALQKLKKELEGEKIAD